MSKAYVLLSGGIDSTTCLYIAMQEYDPQKVKAVGINYGQRHFREQMAAAEICKAVGVDRLMLETGVIPKTMLTDPEAAVPNASYDELKGVSPTYVPFRNGLMLGMISSLAAGDPEAEAIYFGAHAEDARGWAYPDCTPEFIGAMANAIYVGTYHKIRLVTPLEWLTKIGIIRIGQALGVPYYLTWSCYVGGPIHCGVCPTCRARKDGFRGALVSDPTEYAA